MLTPIILILRNEANRGSFQPAERPAANQSRAAITTARAPAPGLRPGEVPAASQATRSWTSGARTSRQPNNRFQPAPSNPLPL